jgi:hypothetical protein
MIDTDPLAAGATARLLRHFGRRRVVLDGLNPGDYGEFNQAQLVMDADDLDVLGAR